MKGRWTEKEQIISKHMVSVASGTWTEEERCDMKGPWIEEERIIKKTYDFEAWTEE